MDNFTKLFLLYLCCLAQTVKVSDKDVKTKQIFTTFNTETEVLPNLQTIDKSHTLPVPDICVELLDNFAQYASDFTLCSIKNAWPVRLCRQCIDQYVVFKSKYQELLNTVDNGTSCQTIYISHDRLDVVLEYYNSILDIWEKGNCNACYDWSGPLPVVSNDTKMFDKMFKETMDCIATNSTPKTNASDEVCERCMQPYLKLDLFYRSLSKDSIGLDSVCFDIVDSMNTTRSIWSKDLNCCKLRKTPEIIFLVCTGIISFLPILFYIAARFCSPIRALPNIFKETRFKQSFMRSSHGRIN
ncbi:osteopetrosis-associated transmembrane protein 1 [Achroia grisella]|uniref:osteopetrosis-associated transmembrane protein 1 n=1 Tax=Achroia grisella TaxID=688607 RepID=UPI0027D251F3|nr:osteopetrosis-associated transmembrane protein 1 [Achroia grisella]